MPSSVKRILIVDDDDTIRQLLRRVLQKEYRLAEATTGEQALEMLPSFLPDLVTLDVQMPGIDGCTTCRRVRSSPLGQRILVMMVSAESTREDQARAYEAGADDYVVKLFDPSELLSRVRLHFRLRDALNAIASIHGDSQRHPHRPASLPWLAAQLTEAEERERRRVAEFLHDHIQPDLVAVKMRSEALRLRLQNQESKEMADEIDHLLNKSIKELRSLTIEICPPVLHEQGLAAGLQWLGPHFREKFDLDIMIEVDPTADPAEETTRLFLFQAVRELLLNVVKHAHADHAWVRMSRAEEPQIRVEVRDDGVGFEPAEQVNVASGGLGMFGIRERLGLLGGRMEVTSAPGKGATVAIDVPATDRGQLAPEPPCASPETAMATPENDRVRVFLANEDGQA
jgi:signal transduction histidine kinase